MTLLGISSHSIFKAGLNVDLKGVDPPSHWSRRNPANATDRAPGRGKRRRSLAIVEDNPDNALLLKTIVSPDYEAVIYTNGEAALEGILEHPPDLILLDISLPLMDGIEVLRHLRAKESTSGIPVIAVTAYGNRESYLSSGFDGYIRKPLMDEKELLNAVARLLKG